MIWRTQNYGIVISQFSNVDFFDVANGSFNIFNFSYSLKDVLCSNFRIAVFRVVNNKNFNRSRNSTSGFSGFDYASAFVGVLAVF